MFDSLDWPDVITTFGLLLDAAGIAMLFFFAPEKSPHPQTKAQFAIPAKIRIPFEKAQNRRRRIASAALGMIFIGFVLQIIAVVSW